MRGVIRVVLIEPMADSRLELESQLGALGSVRLAETCATYDSSVPVVERIRPDLVILGVDTDISRAEATLQALTRTIPDLVVLPVSHTRDADLILRFIRAGAREFLALPCTPAELEAAIGRLIHTLGTGHGDRGDAGSRILAVIGPSGGVGCTSLTVNLAVTLAKDVSREVVLADFDLLTGAVDVCLDLLPEQTVIEVAHSISRLDTTLLMRSLTRHSSGLYVLPGPTMLDEAAKVDPDSLRPVLEMLRDTFPRVVVDLSKSLQTSDIAALEMADVVLMIVTLEPACLRNGSRLLSLFRQIDGLMDKVHVVANRVGATTCEVSVKKAEELLKVPIKWQVVNDVKAFGTSRSKGVTLEAEAAGCRAHRAIVEIAREFDPTAETDKGRSRLGRFAASFF